MVITKKFSSVFPSIFILAFLLLMAASISGCSSAEGRNSAERSDVITAARGMGYSFDSTLISTTYGEDPSQVILEGPIVRSDISGDKVGKTQYTQVIMQLTDGKWVQLSAVKK